MTTGERDCTHPWVNHQHGTIAAYHRDKCRCFPCRLTQSRQRLNGTLRDNALTPSIGVQRRLQALACVGWSAPRIAEHLGVRAQAVHGWRIGHRPTVHRDTAARIAAVYDTLWDRPPPDARVAATVRRHAHACGWLPPLAYDDDTIDDPAAGPAVTPPSTGWDLQPCGTAAAARRHRRHGEPLDAACAAAAARVEHDRRRRQGAA